MTDLELIFSMLGEASTTEIARAGGTIAGDARKALEAKSGKPVVSTENYLSLSDQSSAQLAWAAFIETQSMSGLPSGGRPKGRKGTASFFLTRLLL